MNLNQLETIEFGACFDNGKTEQYFLVPVNRPVQAALVEMHENTLRLFDTVDEDFELFEPAQKYGPLEKLKADLHNPSFSKVKALFQAHNLEMNPDVMRETETLAFYFAVFRDKAGTKVLGVRRATQFKGILKAKRRLIRLIDDSLALVQEDLFRLDTDFDYLVTKDAIRILRPSGFEYTADIDEEISSRAAKMTEELMESVPLIDFGSLRAFVQGNKRAARLLASLRSRDDLQNTSLPKLKKACKQIGISIVIDDGVVRPEEGHEIAFLQLLDRRRYTVSLINRISEYYEAPNRKSVGTVEQNSSKG